MIRLVDAWTLAMTKLRTRKLRTITTAVLASLLFAIIVFAFTTIRGGLDSFARYSKNGLSERYIAQVIYWNSPDQVIDLSDTVLINKAKERNKQVIAEKTAEAKRLGIFYDAAMEGSVTVTDEYQYDGEPYLNTGNYAVNEVVREAQASLPTNVQRVKDLTADYHPTQLYETKSFGDTGNLSVMYGEKEAGIIDQDATAKSAYIDGGSTDSITSLSYLSQSVVESFLLDGADLTPAKTATDEVPIVIPYGEAEKVLGLSSLPKTATNDEKLARFNEVKQKAVNLKLYACYRNGASQDLIAQTKQQIADIKKHKDDAVYQEPSQVYALPSATSCGAVTVTKDTRSAEEKRETAAQHEFNVKYDIEQEATQKKITLRVVGLASGTPDYTSIDSLSSLFLMFGGSSLSGVWVIPSELVDDSIQEKIIPQAESQAYSDVSFRIGNLVEFKSAEDQRKFMDNESCGNGWCGDSKPYITPFGSNSVLIDDIYKQLARGLLIAVGVVASIAAVLMMGMVGRVVADSRRETAVFRAIGARRNDIRAIYVMYTTAFSFIVALSAIALGTLAAAIISAMTTDSMTTTMHLLHVESRETAPVSLVGFWPEALALVIAVMVFVGLFAMLLPLSRNLARNPLKDMRDE